MGSQDDSHAELVRLLRQLVVEVDRFAEMFGDKHGLHRTDLNALTVILNAAQRGDPMSPGRLSAALHLSASATTALLDRLESAGHVRRDRDPTDRRKIELTIAETAQNLGRQFFTPLDREMSQVWSRYSAGERRIIEEFLSDSITATIQVRSKLTE